MPSVEQALDISAPPATVWNIVADPSYLTKLVPDMISNEAEPQGLATVGQKSHSVGKMAGRKVEIFTEITAAEPGKKLIVTQRPGGLFKSFSSAVTLEPSKKGTRATQQLSYEVSMGYLGKALSGIVVNRFVRKNAKAYLTNLKEIAELREMPK